MGQVTGACFELYLLYHTVETLAKNRSDKAGGFIYLTNLAKIFKKLHMCLADLVYARFIFLLFYTTLNTIKARLHMTSYPIC